jgi:very-short-patch-repair endonuclease
MKETRKFIPYSTQLTANARENRRKQTYPEKLMWECLLSGKEFAGLKFTRQKPIDRFIADFYCSELMLAVEIDGDTHDEKKGYDERRTKRLNALGVTVVRYSNDEVLENLDSVREDLKKRVEELIMRRGKTPRSRP